MEQFSPPRNILASYTDSTIRVCQAVNNAIRKLLGMQ